jgi:hypothetical protein
MSQGKLSTAPKEHNQPPKELGPEYQRFKEDKNPEASRLLGLKRCMVIVFT